MCVATRRPSGPPPLSAAEKAEQEAAKKAEKDAREQREAEERRRRDEAREKGVETSAKQQRRGSGATSLLTGSRGGMGYFDETL